VLVSTLACAGNLPLEACSEPGEDTVIISGPAFLGIGESGAYTSMVGGADGAITHEWSVSGPLAVIGPTDRETATIQCSGVGGGRIQLGVNDGACDGAMDVMDVDCLFTDGYQRPFDMNQDGRMDLSDSIALLTYLFSGAPGPECGDGTLADRDNILVLDANGDGTVDLSDAVSVLMFLFLGAARPVNCLDPGCPCLLVSRCPATCAS
jgi:hypothetical protein